MAQGTPDILLDTFGSIESAHQFLDRARGSAVVKLSIERRQKKSSSLDETSTGNNTQVGLNVVTGVMHSNARFVSPNRLTDTAPLIGCVGGWDLSSVASATVQEADWPFFPEVTLKPENVGVEIENPQTFGAGEGTDHVALLASVQSDRSRLTVAGMEDIRETIDRLLQNDGPSHGVCRELARLVHVGLVLCENPQIVEKK